MTSKQRLFFRIVDMLCIVLAVIFSSYCMLPAELHIFSDYTGASCFTVLISFLSFYMMDCYRLVQEELRDSLVRVVIAVLIVTVGAGFVFYTFENWSFPRLIFILQLAIILTLTLGWRVVFYRMGAFLHPTPERVILFGTSMPFLVKKIIKEKNIAMDILGYVAEVPDLEENGTQLGLPQDILEVAAKHKADKILVMDTFSLNDDLAKQLFSAKIHGLQVEDIRSLYERLTGRLPLDHIEEQWLLFVDGFTVHTSTTTKRIKRIFDVSVSLMLCILTLPIICVVALLVWLETRGAIFYSQKRVGLGGREFTVYKIRSMQENVHQDTAQWAKRNDPRVTKVGRFIRHIRIDELPQLINVIRGDMSLIGPRPEQVEFVRELEKKLPYYAVRHTVKPGITGWAQVSYPYGASLEDARCKLEYDLYYIKNMSLLLEVKILLKTIGVILLPSGVR